MDDRLLAARDRLAQLRAEAHIAAAETAQLAARIEQQTYAAWSSGREVRVTVGSDALVRGVEFTETAMTMSPRSLSAAVMDSHHRALTLLRASIEDAVEAAPDTVRGLSGQILAGAREMLPSSDEFPRNGRR